MSNGNDAVNGAAEMPPETYAGLVEEAEKHGSRIAGSSGERCVICGIALEDAPRGFVRGAPIGVAPALWQCQKHLSEPKPRICQANCEPEQACERPAEWVGVRIPFKGFEFCTKCLPISANPGDFVSIKPVDADGYDHAIHTNPDGRAWAKFFVDTIKELADRNTGGCAGISEVAEETARLVMDESYMLGWFSNAMMAMHDCMEGRRQRRASAAHTAPEVVKGRAMDFRRPTMRLAWRQRTFCFGEEPIPRVSDFIGDTYELVQFWESPYADQPGEWRPVEVLP